jgi:hypothetical protein
MQRFSVPKVRPKPAFGPVRKEKAGRRTDCTGIPQVAGKSRELLRQEDFLRWEDAFRAELMALGHTEAELDIRPYGQPWKISLARKLRDKCVAGCAWLADRMRFSSASFIRGLLSGN